MSWQDRLQNTKFTIQTGDGKTWQPLWKNGEKSKDFNFAKYDFINLEGSFIDRKTAQSPAYPLVFFFSGEDNIDQSNDFDNSARDPRQWTVTHPFYGVIKGQPTNLKRNDANYGVTEITVDFWESINDEFPDDSDSIPDIVKGRVSNINATAATNYANNAQPNTSDIPELKSSNQILAARFQPDADNFNDYKRIVATANKDMDKLVSDTETAIGSAQLVISFTSNFNTSIADKINSIKLAYEEIKNVLDPNNRQSKYYFESQAASLISSLADSSVNPSPNDYIVINDINSVNAELLDLYNDYLTTIDNNQISLLDVDNFYSPSSTLQSDLLGLITYTSQALFVLSFDARQERTFLVDKDTNLIVLTHRFLGLDNEDQNLETMKRINNIKLNEIYRVKKNRVITYYV